MRPQPAGPPSRNRARSGGYAGRCALHVKIDDPTCSSPFGDPNAAAVRHVPDEAKPRDYSLCPQRVESGLWLQSTHLTGRNLCFLIFG